MKAKQSIWKKRLVKTTYFMTAILVAALFLGGAASAGFANVSTKEIKLSNQTQAAIESQDVLVNGRAPHGDSQTIGADEYQIGNLARGTPYYVCNVYTSPYNLYTFTPTTPGSPVLLGPVGSTNGFPSGGTFDNDGKFYACAYSGGFYSVNILNGAMTLIGNPGALNGIATNPVDNKMYGISSTVLYTIDKNTGAATTVGSMSGGTMIDICIDKTGNAYMVTVQFSGGSNLYKVNLATGATTLVGPCGVNFCYAQDGNFDLDTGILYWTAYVYPGGTAALYSINTASGAATLVGNMPASWEPDCCAIPYTLKPLDHDVTVTSIDAPIAGPAAASYIPKATVKNVGNNTETFNVECKIWREGVGSTQLWSEGFEAWTPMTNFTIGGLWGVQNNNGFNTWSVGTVAGKARTGFTYVYVRNDTTQNDDTLWVGPISIATNGTNFSFWAKMWQNGAPETFKIGWSNVSGPFVWNWGTPITSTNGATWTKYTLNVPSNLTGQNVWFGINYMSNDWYGMYVDDVGLPGGTIQSFEPALGYFTNATGINWINNKVSGTSAENYWRKATAGDIIYSPDRSPQQGLQMAWYRINGKLQPGDVCRLQMSQPLNLSAFGQQLLSFNFYMYQSTGGSSYQDKCALDISTNNGATWTQLGEWRQYGTTAGWMLRSVSLSGYEDEKAVLFAFRGTAGGTAGYTYGYDITVDNAYITAIPVSVLYTDTKPVTALPINASQQVTFLAWPDPYWQNVTYQNTNVKYTVKVRAILPTDQKTVNNIKIAQPTMYYPYLHDVGVTAIVSPATGPGAPSIPVSYTIKNFGQYPENGLGGWFFTNLTIFDTPSITALNKDFSDSIGYPASIGSKGWTPKRITGTHTTNFSTVTSGTSPSCTPVELPQMLRYNSYSISSGGSDRLSTPPLNFSGLGDLRLKFYMVHDTGYATSADSIRWQWSTDGVTWNDFPGGLFYRSCQLQGLPLTQAWYEWKVDATAITNMSSVRLGILAYSAYGNNMYLDNVRLTKLSDGSVAWKEGFNTSVPAGANFAPGWTKIQTDPLKPWFVYGTTPSAYYARCEETGSVGAQKEWLITPTFSCAGIIQPWVQFNRQLYLGTGPDSVLTVYYTLNNGTTWNTIVSWNTNQIAQLYQQAVPGIAGQPFVQLAFNFSSTNDVNKFDYATIDNILVTEKASIQEYMVPYVPPGVLNPGDSLTCTPINWVPAVQPSGPHNYKAIANTFLVTDNNTANNQLVKTFTLTWGHDLSVDAIIQPAIEGAIWLGPGAHPVSAKIKNLGTFTETSTATAEIIYTSNSTVAYTSTFPIAALAPGANVTATFASFTSTVSDSFKLSVTVPADDNLANNKKELNFGVDVTPPTSTHTLNPGTPNGQNNWYVSDVTVTLTATDAHSGVLGIKYKLDAAGPFDYTAPFVVTTDGDHTVKYYAIDKLNNIETEHSVAIKIDKTKPTGSFTATEQTGKKYLLACVASDATSGIAKVEFYAAGALINTDTSSPYEFLYEGKDGPVKCIVYDNAGNSWESPEISVTTTESSQIQIQQHQQQSIFNQWLVKQL